MTSPFAHPIPTLVACFNFSHCINFDSRISSILRIGKMVQSPPKNIVVIGGGIAGTTTAYFLAQSAARAGAKITLVEGTKVAAGASGYSGGFLAKDWHGSATASE